jgi:hypothetical protein
MVIQLTHLRWCSSRFSCTNAISLHRNNRDGMSPFQDAEAALPTVRRSAMLSVPQAAAASPWGQLLGDIG